MQFVPLNNTKLLKLLTTIIDVLYTPDLKKLISKTVVRNDNLVTGVHPCSDEYLFEAFKHKVSDYGYPRACLGLGMVLHNSDPNLIKVVEPINNHVLKVGRYLGAPTNALTMAYPDKGFIGWHHNGNAPGFNILMSYSQDGDGHFSYWDRKKEQIIKMPDKKGWSVKVGYYPDERKNTDKVYWHCASTAKQRVSIAFVLNHRNMWENMIDMISDGTFDKEILRQDQMVV